MYLYNIQITLLFCIMNPIYGSYRTNYRKKREVFQTATRGLWGFVFLPYWHASGAGLTVRQRTFKTYCILPCADCRLTINDYIVTWVPKCSGTRSPELRNKTQGTNIEAQRRSRSIGNQFRISSIHDNLTTRQPDNLTT
jgi:hypothetical protein